MIFKAFGRAFREYFGHPVASLKFLLTQLCLTLIVLTPLVMLSDSSLMPFAALSAVLFVLILLPARVNAASAMQDSLGDGSIFSYRLADPSEYWRKVGHGLSRGVLLAVWGAPLIACAVIAWNNISGETDGFTLLRSIKTFGGGDTITGVVYLAGILAGAILLFVIGLGFHSGDRHAMVLGGRKLGNRRFRILGCWLCSLVIFLPLIAAVADTVLRYLPVIRNLDGLLMGMTELPSTKTTVIILAAGVLLTIPLIPLRSLVVAAYVKGIQGKPDEDKA